MRCLYCLKEKEELRLESFLWGSDPLCFACRKEMKGKIRKGRVKEMDFYYLYPYEGLFKSVLLQYKECFDEALYSVFLYSYQDLLKLAFHSYYLCCVPSTEAKMERRGFNHLEKTFEGLDLKLKRVGMKREYSQHKASLRDRKRMLDNYYLVDEFNEKDKILLVDDVLTSGSSLLGVYRILKPKAKKIVVLSLGKVTYDDS